MSGGQRSALRVILIVVSAVFILFGGFRGEIKTVFVKGANLCLECIGIG